MRLYAGLADLAEQVVTLVFGRCLSPSWAVMYKGQEGAWMCQVASSGADHQLQVPGHIPRGPEHHSRGHFSHVQGSCQASAAYIYGNCLIKSVKVVYYYGIFSHAARGLNYGLLAYMVTTV
jgi:hypothetical protein